MINLNAPKLLLSVIFSIHVSDLILAITHVAKQLQRLGKRLCLLKVVLRHNCDLIGMAGPPLLLLHVVVLHRVAHIAVVITGAFL